RFAVIPKPRLCCFMCRIVSGLHVDAKHVAGRFMQTFPRAFVSSPRCDLLHQRLFMSDGVSSEQASNVSEHSAADDDPAANDSTGLKPTCLDLTRLGGMGVHLARCRT
ncbi:hypothetical protein M4R23_05900, partial [Acidovorax sp. GBBC 3332]